MLISQNYFLASHYPITIPLSPSGVTVSVERSHYNYREGQNSGLLPICANLTGEIERNLSVAVQFHAETAQCKQIATT